MSQIEWSNLAAPRTAFEHWIIGKPFTHTRRRGQKLTKSGDLRQNKTARWSWECAGGSQLEESKESLVLGDDKN